MADSDNTPQGSPVDLDYELIRMIGRGGYGEVWLVRDKEGEYRACKVVHRESFQHDRPYEREFEGICKFEPVSRGSQSQVKILHVGRRDAAGCFYYIMELADDANGNSPIHPDTYIAKTLRTEMERRGRLPAAEAIKIGLALSEALENLHEHGLIHRDIKPANIIFVDHVPKLADIGLVTDADVTVSYVGTEGFIPPEGPSSPQADVYGLGKVLYEISTGQDRLEYPELPADFGELPDRETLLELNFVVAKACETNPCNRYASARELRADLLVLHNGKSIRRARSAQRTRRIAGRIAVALGVIALLAAVLVYLPRKPVAPTETVAVRTLPPDAARIAQSEDKIKETYKRQLTDGTSAAKQTAAAELVKQSSASLDPAVQLASLRVAELLAAQAEDISLAMEICETMTGRFQIDRLSAKAEMLAQAAEYTRNVRRKSQLAGLCVKTGFEAIAADDYTNGMKISELAKSSAKDGGDPRLAKEADFLGAEMARSGNGFESVQKFENALRTNPNDPEANLAVGKFLCFVKNDWDAGLPLMARGGNGALNPVLAAEMNAEPKASDGQIALANSWRALSDLASAADKIFFQQRARYWYLKAIATAKKQDRDRLLKQFNDWIQTVPTEAGEVHIFSRLAGTESIDIYSDEVRWKSGRGAISSKINEVKLDDLKPADLVIIKNSEATRLLPATVDFSTAQLIIDHKPNSKRQGRAKLEKAPDHARIVLVHPGNGYVELEVTVTFGNPP